MGSDRDVKIRMLGRGPNPLQQWDEKQVPPALRSRSLALSLARSVALVLSLSLPICLALSLSLSSVSLSLSCSLSLSVKRLVLTSPPPPCNPLLCQGGGTSLIRNHLHLGPYSRPLSRAMWQGHFLAGCSLPLHCSAEEGVRPLYLRMLVYLVIYDSG